MTLVGNKFKVSRRGLLLASLCAPLLLSLTAVAVGRQPQEISDLPQLPALVFDQYLVDFHEVPPMEEVVARFAFRNVGNETVEIKKLIPSCGCLQPDVKKKTYEPQEAGQFFLRVQTPNQDPGQKEYRVKVQYEDPLPRERDLVFKVVLPQNQVLVRPKVLSIYHGSEASESIEELVITDLRTRPLEILGVSCTSQYVKAEVLPTDYNIAGPQRHRIKIMVQGAIPSGRHHSVVVISTDDPNQQYRELRVPLMLEGGTRTASRQVRAYGPDKLQ